jgi:hypothetical protein
MIGELARATQDIECLQRVQFVIQDGRVAWDGHHLTWDGRA